MSARQTALTGIASALAGAGVTAAALSTGGTDADFHKAALEACLRGGEVYRATIEGDTAIQGKFVTYDEDGAERIVYIAWSNGGDSMLVDVVDRTGHASAPIVTQADVADCLEGQAKDGVPVK